MKRIYFDKQIFSHHRDFLNEIKQHRSNFFFCFSHAHLLDIRGSEKGSKQEDLEFMETVVGDNFLQVNEDGNGINCFLRTPFQANKEFDESGFSEERDFSFDLESLFDSELLLNLSDEQKSKFEESKRMLNEKSLDFDLLINSAISKEVDVDLLNRVLPSSRDNLSFIQWMQHFMGLLGEMYKDRTIYRDVRNSVEKHNLKEKYIISNGTIDPKSFFENVISNLSANGTKEVSDYSLYTNSYTSLDILGISRENSGKVKFKNLIYDAIHSFYGIYCDYVVSADNGFLNKTRILYKLFNIRTKVLHINEFKDEFPDLLKEVEHDGQSFFNSVMNDLNKEVNINSNVEKVGTRIIIDFTTDKNYLGFFNFGTRYFEDGITYLVLSNNRQRVLYFRELEGVVNLAVKIFGVDSKGLGEYSRINENNLVLEQQWQGRFWNFNRIKLWLEINSGTKMFHLVLAVTP